MKYLFVTISILVIWVCLVAIILILNYEGIDLALLGLIMTIILFEIGFGGKK